MVNTAVTGVMAAAVGTAATIATTVTSGEGKIAQGSAKKDEATQGRSSFLICVFVSLVSWGDVFFPDEPENDKYK